VSRRVGRSAGATRGLGRLHDLRVFLVPFCAPPLWYGRGMMPHVRWVEPCFITLVLQALCVLGCEPARTRRGARARSPRLASMGRHVFRPAVPPGALWSGQRAPAAAAPAGAAEAGPPSARKRFATLYGYA